METRKLRAAGLALALAAPLVLIAGVLVRGALQSRWAPPVTPAEPERSPGARPSATGTATPSVATTTPRPPAPSPDAAARSSSTPTAAWRPALDLPAARLEERVDGGAEALRAAGFTRLLFWRSEAPAADLEALVFANADAARAALAREAGAERTPGPGDEAQVGPQAVYSRHGRVLVRAFADPGAAGGPALADLVRRLAPQLEALR